jgi:hypothetical protein
VVVAIRVLAGLLPVLTRRLWKPVNKLPPPLLLPANIKATAVVMNHARPWMLRHGTLMETLATHPAVSEILLLHSNPETAFTYHHDKVKNIDASEKNEEIGLALRFHYCAEAATNDWVLLVDDDMEMDAVAITQLIWKMRENSRRIVGKYGRRYSYWRAPNRRGYDTTNLPSGPAEVVLTKVLMLERQVCQAFFQYSHLVDDLVPQSKPLWNGEDIFVSLVANHVYGVPPHGPYSNYALADLPVWEADEKAVRKRAAAAGVTVPQQDSVSGNLNKLSVRQILNVHALYQSWRKAQRHTAYRGMLWHTAKQRLGSFNKK